MKFLPLNLLVLITGIVLVIIPDYGPAVIRFNKEHGPSLMDIIGLAMIMVAWLMFVYKAWCERKRIRQTLGPVRLYSILATIIVFSLLIVIGLKTESDVLLFGSSIVNVVCQAVLFRIALHE